MTASTTTPVADARAAFIAAVRSGANAAAEYLAWKHAAADAAAQAARQRQAIQDANKAQVDESNRLAHEARDLTAMATYIGRDINLGSSHGASRVYTAEEHEARVTRWRAALAAYLESIGQPADTTAIPVHQDAAVLPPMPKYPPMPPVEVPPPYDVAVQRAAAGEG